MEQMRLLVKERNKFKILFTHSFGEKKLSTSH